MKNLKTMIVLILLAGFVLYLLSDTIADVLSEGKSFAPNELKSFR